MDKVLIIEGKLKGISLKMYGENHLDIDNSFYTSLKMTSGLILVEHSTTHTVIQPSEENLFKMYANGSEWVFYTETLKKNPNLIVFDTREEQGYMNAFQENLMFEIAENIHLLSGPQIRYFTDNCLKFFQTFSKNKEWFNVFDNYYERSLVLLESQFKVIIALLKLHKKDKDALIMEMHPISRVMAGVASIFILNIKKIASVSVDINLLRILNSLASSQVKEVMLFAGKNHVLRMFDFLNLKDAKKSGISEDMGSEIEIEGDLQQDKTLLEFINSALKKA